MIKVYEMKGMNACKMSTEYRGVNIKLSFENGNVSSGRNARLTTDNRFVQDAIEALPIFGTKVVLAHSVEKTVVQPIVAEEEEERSPRMRRQVARGTVVKKAKEASENGSTIVDEVRNINDAASYFMEKGVTVESKEQLEELMQKHNVVFPNIK
jgi:hypothetical protein